MNHTLIQSLIPTFDLARWMDRGGPIGISAVFAPLTGRVKGASNETSAHANIRSTILCISCA